ncbi:hypothetical protein [Marinilabilia rubra]|uniref:Uncharacterized protein n=1 Tax=Marinilabilia rubra TaxID=2162893 RepID=A0A2U2B9A4_9BACT|nr:hypothetical protein [Marinilabilia rubra]PWD99624.1 hypothetical protein DDZ16_09260 [Marinilabilia rubra]
MGANYHFAEAFALLKSVIGSLSNNLFIGLTDVSAALNMTRDCCFIVFGQLLVNETLITVRLCHFAYPKSPISAG